MSDDMKVLIIEDDLILALSLKLMLKKLNITNVEKVHTGEDAVESVNKCQPGLMLVDIQLGAGISGIDAVEEIQETYNIPALFITGNSDSLNRELADRTNYIDYLVKPITFKELQNAVSKVGV